LLYRWKRRWRNGTTEVGFDRNDFIAKLAALVPAPRAHLRTYHGILAPGAKWRPRIVPTADVQFGVCAHVPVPPDSNRHPGSEPDADGVRVRSRRAEGVSNLGPAGVDIPIQWLSLWQ